LLILQFSRPTYWHGVSLLHCRSPYLERLERVDNLGAYRIPPETGLLIPSVMNFSSASPWESVDDTDALSHENRLGPRKRLQPFPSRDLQGKTGHFRGTSASEQDRSS
jgi:hypothetical protein